MRPRATPLAAPATEAAALVTKLEHRAEVCRIAGADFYDLPARAQNALYGIAAELDDATSLLDALVSLVAATASEARAYEAKLAYTERKRDQARDERNQVYAEMTIHRSAETELRKDLAAAEKERDRLRECVQELEDNRESETRELQLQVRVEDAEREWRNAAARHVAAEKERDEARAACKKAIRERRSLEIKEDDWHSAYESAERRAAETEAALREAARDMVVLANGQPIRGTSIETACRERADYYLSLSVGGPERTTT